MLEGSKCETASKWYQSYFEGEDYDRFNVAATSQEVTRSEVDRLEKWIAPAPGDLILDACCGAGRHAYELRNRGYEVLGIDLSPGQLARSRRERHLVTAQPHFVRADVRHIPLKDRTCGAVICMFNSFGFFSDADEFRVIQEYSRVLKTGGWLVLEVMNRDAYLLEPQPRIWDHCQDGFVLQEVSFIPTESRLLVEWTFLPTEGSQRIISTVHRIYSVHELVAMFWNCGIEVIDVKDGPGAKKFHWRDSIWMTLLGRKT